MQPSPGHRYFCRLPGQWLCEVLARSVEVAIYLTLAQASGQPTELAASQPSGRNESSTSGGSLSVLAFRVSIDAECQVKRRSSTLHRPATMAKAPRAFYEYHHLHASFIQHLLGITSLLPRQSTLLLQGLMDGQIRV